MSVTPIDSGPAAERPRIRKFLDLSTNHLPEHLLNNLNDFNGVVAYPAPYGAWLWVPDDPQARADENAWMYRAGEEDGDDFGDGFAPEILVVQLYARQFGCDYILFDADAEIDPALPSWPW